MRMRKKKNLAEKMESVSDILSVLHSDDPKYVTSAEKKEYLDTEAIFGNSNPIVLEVGCGKGTFACELAKRNPDLNILALEKCANVVVLAGEKAMNEGQEVFLVDAAVWEFDPDAFAAVCLKERDA